MLVAQYTSTVYGLSYSYLFRSPLLPEIKLRPSWVLAQELPEEHFHDGKRVDLDAGSPVWHAERHRNRNKPGNVPGNGGGVVRVRGKGASYVFGAARIHSKHS